jgi:hypothetical protein
MLLIYEIPDTQDTHFRESRGVMNAIPANAKARTRVLREYGGMFGFAAREVKPVEILLVAKLQDALQSLRTEISNPTIQS